MAAVCLTADDFKHFSSLILKLSNTSGCYHVTQKRGRPQDVAQSFRNTTLSFLFLLEKHQIPGRQFFKR